jgi:hypothetical protein
MTGHGNGEEYEENRQPDTDGNVGVVNRDEGTEEYQPGSEAGGFGARMAAGIKIRKTQQADRGEEHRE